MSLAIKLPPHNAIPLDESLLRGSGEEYFWSWLLKHRSQKTDVGGNAGEHVNVKKSRSCYAKVRKKRRIQQAVRS